LLLKWTYNSLKIKYISYTLVFHRRHLDSVTAKSDCIIPHYLKEAHEAINYYAKFSKKILLKLNAKWHLGIIRIIYSAGNKGFLCNLLNYIRLNFQLLRFYNILLKTHLIT